MKDKNKDMDIINSIKVLISPWDRGFTCGIIKDKKAKMTAEQYELCSTIARGMIKFANDQPDKAFNLGMKGYAEDFKKSRSTKNNGVVLDFLEALNKKKRKFN